MKVRSKTVCRTCRRRKLGCDGKRPACSQCLHSGRLCEGYIKALFVPFVPVPAAANPTLARSPEHTQRPAVPLPSTTSTKLPIGNISSSRSSGDPSASGKTTVHGLISRQSNGRHGYPIYPTLPGTWQDAISLIVRNYVPHRELACDITNESPHSPRICGSWVTALLDLALGATGVVGEYLDSAITALALSITAHRTGKPLLQPISSLYDRALSLLRNDLQLAAQPCRDERAAIIMCLSLLEVLSPTKPTNWLVHVHGVGELTRLLPPESFSTSIRHTLFIGYRPLLVLEALITRKATFCAERDWTRLPFQHHQPAPLQSLLSLAATIPEVLEKIDAMECEPFHMAAIAARQRLAELEKVRANLEAWGYSLESESPRPLYWFRTAKDDLLSYDEFLGFPNLSVANGLTYLWSFQIICLSHMENLLKQYPDSGGSKVSGPKYARNLRAVCIELGRKVFQSIEYLLQPEFMLYGVSSAGFPLYTAHKTMERDERGRAVLQKFHETIRGRSHIEKFLSLPRFYSMVM